MTENDVKTTKNDEKRVKNDRDDENMAVINDYRAYLTSKLEEAKAGIDYYSRSKNGEWNHKRLAAQWKKKKEDLQAKLNKERINPEEFAADANWWHKRNSFKLHQ